MKKSITSLILLTTIIIGTASAALLIERTLSSHGQVVVVIPPNLNIQVYSDAACTQVVTDIDWGVLDAGGSASRTVYIKNAGNVAAILSMVVQSWNPATAAQYVTITWDAEGKVINVGQSVTVVMKCTVSASTAGITTFSNSIIVRGTG